MRFPNRALKPFLGDLALQGEIVAICNFSGLIATTQLEREILRPDDRPMVRYYFNASFKSHISKYTSFVAHDAQKG